MGLLFRNTTALSAFLLIGCWSGSARAGSTILEIQTNDGLRRSRLLVPEKEEPPNGRPLLLQFHGWGSNAESMERATGWLEIAQRENWLLATPDGIDHSWNAGVCCGGAVEKKVDDIAFIRALVKAVASKHKVDRSRIFATGFSNGGFLSVRAACEASDLIAAVASVGGGLGIESCTPQRKIPVLLIHGDADDRVPYSTATDTYGKWKSLAGCSTEDRNTLSLSDADCVAPAQCTPPMKPFIELCTAKKAGHWWPRSNRPDKLDTTLKSLRFFGEAVLY